MVVILRYKQWREDPHGRSDSHRWTAVVGFEYLFITRGVVKRRSDCSRPWIKKATQHLRPLARPAKSSNVLLIRCSKSKCVFARVVPCQCVGENDFVVEIIINDFCGFGYTTFILKASKENGIQTLLASVIDRGRYDFTSQDQTASLRQASH